MSTENKHPFLDSDEMGVILLISGVKAGVDKRIVKKVGGNPG